MHRPMTHESVLTLGEPSLVGAFPPVALIGSPMEAASRLVSHLPSGISQVVGPPPDGGSAEVEAVVVVVAVPDLTTRLGLMALRQAAESGIPWLLVTGLAVESLRRWPGIRPDSVLFSGEESRLWPTINNVLTAQPLMRLARAIEQAPNLPGVVRRALIRPVADAVARPLRSQRRAPTVAALAALHGCSPAYLSREAGAGGFPAGMTLRWTTLLTGLRCYREGRWTWSRVACRLGFDSSGAWSNHVGRLVQMSPTAIASATRHTIFNLMVRDLPGMSASLSSRVRGHRTRS